MTLLNCLNTTDRPHHKIIPVCSSSQGNAFLIISSSNTCILIDAGSPVYKITSILNALNIEKDRYFIENILISHEHTDHVSYLYALSKKFHSKIYCNLPTKSILIKKFPKLQNFKIFSSHQWFKINDIEIFPFIVPHDAVETSSFVIRLQNPNTTIAICIDIGHINSYVVSLLQEAEHIILESNYDDSLIQQSNRPRKIISRITSKFGHLSNRDCKNLLEALTKSGRLKTLTIAHISEECNRDDYIQTNLSRMPISIYIARDIQIIEIE